MSVALGPLRNNDHTPIDESLRRLRTLISPYAGIGRTFGEIQAAASDAKLFTAVARLADSRDTTGSDPGHQWAGGSGRSRERAAAAALGELAERYSGTFIDPDDLYLGTVEELDVEAIGPDAFKFFTEEQYSAPDFDYVRFTRRTRINWVRGFALLDGRDVWLPAQLIYLRPSPLTEDEEAVAYGTSNGMACGSTLEEAVLAGLLELVERDAVMSTWYARLSLPILDWSGDDRLASYDRDCFAKTGLHYKVVNLTPLSGIPTALAVLRTPPGVDDRPFVLGAASAITIQDAAFKALAEAFGGRRSMAARLREGGEPPTNHDEVSSFMDHALYYIRPDMLRHTTFLDGGQATSSTRNGPDFSSDTPFTATRCLAQHLAGQGISAYVADVTSPDIADAGLYVVHVVSPELCAIDVGYRHRFLGNPRLYSAARRLGLRSTDLGPQEINPHPHPFP